MIISDQQRENINAYIQALEKFCAYSINDEISSFWIISKKPNLILKWREKTAIKLYKREENSRIYSPVYQQPGIILQTSGFLGDNISDDDNEKGCLTDDGSDWIQTIKDIDRQICKGLCSELCDPDSIDGSELSDEQRAHAIAELRKPLKYHKSKDTAPIQLKPNHR